MPELPEVETVRQGLLKLVKNKRIRTVEVRWPKIVNDPEVPIFEAELKNEVIENIDRRGKYLIFHLSHWDMISHLRMEGKYEYFEERVPEDKHIHVVFAFTDGTYLCYRDVRKFGRMTLVAKGTAENNRSIMQLGPEPTEPDFSFAAFFQGLQKSHKAIKPLLLDQKLITGLGNIYVDEALWEAKIHPVQPADTISAADAKVLRRAIIDVLARAIKAGGTTIRTYLNALGEAGSFQVQLHVYGQTGKPCIRCGTPIIKIKVAQRGTHLCPHCQKLNGER